MIAYARGFLLTLGPHINTYIHNVCINTDDEHVGALEWLMAEDFRVVNIRTAHLSVTQTEKLMAMMQGCVYPDACMCAHVFIQTHVCVHICLCVFLE
jgi:hypothetical protein